MKTASVVQLKKELKHRSEEELMELCLRLSKFKKENKELLTYLLFESDYEAGYINSVKEQIDNYFEAINTSSYFYIKKSVRKILRETKKFIRYSGNKETEVILLLYFCEKLKAIRPKIAHNVTLQNLYNRQLDYIAKKIDALHEDLQLDYQNELEALE